MANINPKLNLNKTPFLVENNSLIFAKNIRLDVDGTIHRDYGVLPMSFPYGKNTVDSAKKVQYNTLLNRIIHDIETTNVTRNSSYYNEVLNFIRYCDGDNHTINNKNITNGKFTIVGIIPSNNEFYVFVDASYLEDNNKVNNSYIFNYDEKEDLFSVCECNWNYSNGVIDGCVINNLLGEKIINIGETNGDKLVPLKCINIDKATENDDETIYTQTPNIPLTNLNFVSYFNYTIPNGVYQFFIRYKIRDNFYTDWFPASKELFAGNNTNINTSFGTVSYLNNHKDSDNSFVFGVKHLIEKYINNYKSFQIGFICSHDDAIVARAWKHFEINTSTINFDYESKDAYEIEVIDLIKTSYQIYDVGNITSFKNKLYISNYKETNFNETNLQEYANKIGITCKTYNAQPTYAGCDVLNATVQGKKVISGLIIDEEDVYLNDENGIIHHLLTDYKSGYKYSIKDVIENTIWHQDDNYITQYNDTHSKYYGFTGHCISQTLNAAKEVYKGNHTSISKDKFTFGDDIKRILININNSTYSINLNNTVDDLIRIIYRISRYLSSEYQIIGTNGEINNYVEISIVRDCSYISDTVVNDEYSQYIYIWFYGDKNEYEDINLDKILHYTTLIPYQKYKFYVHYVKQNGEITNGYYCNGENAGVIEANYSRKADCAIYPSFSNIEIPEGYVACFFSIVHFENKVATVYNIDNSGDVTESSCMDINVGLYSGISKLTIQQIVDGTSIETTDAKYYYSSDSSDSLYFGADGIIVNSKNDKLKENNLAYAVNNYSISESEDVQLIKCTQYITNSLLKNNTYEDCKNMNLLGYICKVYPLSRSRTKKYYTDGSSVYIKQNVDNTETSSLKFSLLELKNHILDTSNPNERVTALNLTTTEPVYIYSNYNLNYLQLSEEPKSVYKTYYNNSSNDNTNNDSYNMVLRLFSSLTMSSVYELPSMYHSYTRKTYSVFNETTITKFDNTVRSSQLESDESDINIFKFDANDYYNIPTNRGIIVNLVAIGDAILVHTQDSMFKFSGSNTLQSSDGEIQTVESTPFDTGVSEIFGSDFGFAGLQNKTDHIITENGYIFFDRDSRIVYLYSGQGQIVKISDSIEKLFRYKDIKNIYFANDYYNNRFFMCIIFYEINTNYNNSVEKTYPVTLSFSTLQDVKSFVSLHDFYYFYAFNTKTKCYFLSHDNSNIYSIDKGLYGIYGDLSIIDDKVYPNNKFNYYMSYSEEDKPSLNNHQIKLSSYDSIVDVIDNNNYENVKTLNSINWCSRIIKSEYEDVDKNDYDSIKMAEDINTFEPCKGIRVYTDTCMTPITDCTKVSNNYNISSSSSYMYPRYNQGVWTHNYFRNIQNANNNTNRYISDENSLIEGKYFVVRFFFDKEFKLETLSLNYRNKI